MISKMVKKLDVASVDGAYYKLPMLKKNIWAYTAAFIDSDGYITMVETITLESDLLLQEKEVEHLWKKCTRA